MTLSSLSINYLKKANHLLTLKDFFLLSDGVGCFAYGIYYYALVFVDYNWVNAAARGAGRVHRAPTGSGVIEDAVAFTIPQKCIAILVIAHELLLTVSQVL